MRIGDNWELTSDERNYIIKEYKLNKCTGETDLVPRYYFSTLRGAVAQLTNLGIRETEMLGMGVIMDKLSEIEDMIATIKEECKC